VAKSMEQAVTEPPIGKENNFTIPSTMDRAIQTPENANFSVFFLIKKPPVRQNGMEGQIV